MEISEGGRECHKRDLLLLTLLSRRQPAPSPAKLSIPYPLDVDETSLLAMHMSWKSSLEGKNTAGIFFCSIRILRCGQPECDESDQDLRVGGGYGAEEGGGHQMCGGSSGSAHIVNAIERAPLPLPPLCLPFSL